jgi:hypothetical protein
MKYPVPEPESLRRQFEQLSRELSKELGEDVLRRLIKELEDLKQKSDEDWDEPLLGSAE